MNITHLDHLVITTNDVNKALDFYVGLLGMTLDDSNGRVAVKFGNQKINFHRGKAEFLPAAGNVAFGSADICLISEGDINEIEQELKAKNAPIELSIVQRTGACGPIDSIYLRDPDENLVEVSVYRK